MKITYSVNVKPIEAKVVEPKKLTAKDKLVAEAIELGVETDGLTTKELQEAIATAKEDKVD